MAGTMAPQRTILVLGRDALAHDVARVLVGGDGDLRVVVVSTTAGSAQRTLDPASAGFARDLADLLDEARPTTLALLAFSQSAVTPEEPWVADAALADGVVSALQRFVDRGGRPPALLLLTSTAVYGVAVDSPLVFDEQSRLPRETAVGSSCSRWAEGLRAAERSLVGWAVSAGVVVGVLRPVSVLGGPMDSPVAGLLSAALPVRVLGYDPPCQVMHYEDLVQGVALAIVHGCGEVLNLVGRSVVPLSRLLALAGVFAPPLAGPIADRLAPASMDGRHLRWRTLADGTRAAALLGFRPQHSLEDCFGGRS